MAMSKAVPDEDRTRFCRLSLVIVEELPLILQDVLHREVSPNLLHHMVMKHKKGLEHLGQHQIIQVKNAKASGYSEFDITLLYTLLRNYFKKSIQPPTNGWGKQEMPEQGQETEGDDIERIRLIRNKHNHIVMVSVPTISETEFNEKWGIIHAVCARMQTRLPNIQHNYVQMLEESKIRTIDSDMEKTYIDKIKELAKEEMSVKTLLLELVKEKDLTSKEKITIQARKDHKKDIVKLFTDVSIRIFNEMVDPTYRLTSKSELKKLYKATQKFLKEHKKDIEDDQLHDLLKRLEEKIKDYANLDEKNRTNILSKFLNFNLKMKKKYGASMSCSIGSIILSVTFSSTESYSHYKKDLEKGIIGEEILQIILYPPYLASFDLTAEDLIVCLNDQELTEDNKAIMAGKDLDYDCLLIYNNEDSSFSDGGTREDSSLLFRYVDFVDRKLNLCKYRIHHLDRDSIPGRSVFYELERVIESSQVILLILDKGFLRNSWKCFSQEAAIKNLIDTSTDPKCTTSNRLIPVLIHLEKNEIPSALKTLTSIEIMEESDIDKNWKNLKKAIDPHLGPQRIPRSTVARNPQYSQLTPKPQYAPAVSKEPRVNPKSNGPSCSLLSTDVEPDAPQSMSPSTAATVQQSVASPQNQSSTSQRTPDSDIGLMSPELGFLNVASFLPEDEAPESIFPSNQIANSVTLQDEPDSAVNQSPEGPNTEDGERPSFFFRAIHFSLHAILQPDKVYAPP